MSDRWWYLVTCPQCSTDPRVFDIKRERDQWAAQHILATEHNVHVARSQTRPTYKPRVNCALCVNLGTQSDATLVVYDVPVCETHKGVMQIAGATCTAEKDVAYSTAGMMTRALAILSHTIFIARQED